ncbi:MAG: acyl-CoA dehydrogenase family protein [Thermoplasmataceae archaeon]
MDFDFPEELEEIRKRIREFGLREFRPDLAEKYDREEKYPNEIRKKAFEAGIIDYQNPWGMLLAIEELCRIDAGLGISATVSLFGEEVIMLFGTEQQKEKYLTKVNNGELIMGLAVTEPSGGSDVAGIKTNATRSGDRFIINGAKMFITNGQIADFVVMLVRTSPPNGKRHHGLSTIIVDTKSKGFTANKLEGKLGVRATNTAELVLNNVEVPVENLVGPEGKGFYHIMTFFNISRVYVAAQGLGIAQGAFDRMLQYIKKARALGTQDSTSESSQFILADVATKIEAARLLTYKAASYLFQFKPNPILTSMAKWQAAEAAVFAAEKAMELTGITGISSDLERFYRDAKILEIWEGTSEVEKLIIARMLTKDEGSQ